MDPNQTVNETALDEFYRILGPRAREVAEHMVRLMSRVEVGPPMREVIDYVLASTGKHIRSVLLLWASELFVEKADGNAMAAAVALELVHTYSLIHDDLPAMDDDDVRRGRPTCHKVFGEALAILAGDALLTVAFELLAREVDEADLALALARELASAAGPAGMIAGQAADMGGEGDAPTAEQLDYIHLNKTAKLFRCAAVMGGLCAGAGPDPLGRLSEFGLNVGLGFQIADDILDIQGSTEQLGKTVGKDQKAGKVTYPALFGIERAESYARDCADRAVVQLADFGPRAEYLRQLGRVVVCRKH